MKGQVLILESVHPIMARELTAMGYQVVEELSVEREAILAGAFPNAVGVVVRSRFMIDLPLFEALPRLQFVARSGSGLENIDLEAAGKRGVHVVNSPEGNAAAVGEHVIGMILNLLNNMRSADASVRNGQWQREAHRGRELGARTVGIVGFGHMGQAVAQRLSGFGCRMLAHDKYKSGFHGYLSVEEATMEQLREVCDVVTLHVPLTPETDGFVNDAWLSGWQKPIVLINAARGQILQNDSLLAALNDGRVAAAGLDVLENEGRDLLGIREASLSLRELTLHEKTMFTPHVAGWTEESYLKLASTLLEKIRRFDST